MGPLLLERINDQKLVQRRTEDSCSSVERWENNNLLQHMHWGQMQYRVCGQISGAEALRAAATQWAQRLGTAAVYKPGSAAAWQEKGVGYAKALRLETTAAQWEQKVWAGTGVMEMTALNSAHHCNTQAGVGQNTEKEL